MADSDLTKLLVKCIKHRFVHLNELDDNNLKLTFTDTLNRIDSLLKRRTNDDLQWVMRTYPKLGSCLTVLRSHPAVICDKYLFSIVMKCILWFYRSDAYTIPQQKANLWVRNQIQNAGLLKTKELLLEKLEDTTCDETLRAFWVENYKLLDLIEDRKTKQIIDENLIRLVAKDPLEQSAQKIVENIWNCTNKSSLNEEMKQTLWLLHAPGLESDVISLLQSENADNNNQLFVSCGLNPDLYSRVVCILFSIFKSTNYHPKPLQLAARLIDCITKKSSSDLRFCSRLHPLLWLLSSHPRDYPDRGFIWKTLEQVPSKDEVAFLLAVHSNWLRFLLRSVSFQPEMDILSTCTRLFHSQNCRRRLLGPRDRVFSFSQCRKCVAVSLCLGSSMFGDVRQVASCLSAIVSSVNLKVLLDWWQQE